MVFNLFEIITDAHEVTEEVQYGPVCASPVWTPLPHTQETGLGTLCVDSGTAMFSRTYFRKQHCSQNAEPLPALLLLYAGEF